MAYNVRRNSVSGYVALYNVSRVKGTKNKQSVLYVAGFGVMDKTEFAKFKKYAHSITPQEKRLSILLSDSRCVESQKELPQKELPKKSSFKGELTKEVIQKKLSDAGIEPDPDDCIGTGEEVAKTLGGKLVIGYYTEPRSDGGVLYQPHVWNKVDGYTIDMTSSQIPDSNTDLVITKQSHPDADEIIEIDPEKIGDYDIEEVVDNRREYLDE